MKNKFTSLLVIVVMFFNVGFVSAKRTMPDGEKPIGMMTIDQNAFFGPAKRGNVSSATSLYKPKRTPADVESAARMPRRAAALDSNIEGYMMYNTQHDYISWWKLNTKDASSTKLWSNAEIEEVSAGFVVNGIVYAFYYYDTMGLEYAESKMMQFDVATGELKGTMDLGVSDYSTMVLTAAYDETEKVAYVYTYNADHYAVDFKKFDIRTGEFTYVNTSELFTTNPIVAMAYNPVDGQIYGVTYNGCFTQIDKTTGEYTDDCSVGFYPAYIVQAMVYSPFDRAFVYASTEDDANWTPRMLLIDPFEKEVILERELYNEEQYAILHCSDPIVADGAPAPAEIQNIVFDGASTSGNVVLLMPETTFEGEQLESDLTVEILLDGNQYGETFTASAGETVTVELTGLSVGLHKFAVATYYNGIRSIETAQNFYVGNDYPAMPQNVVLTETQLSWDKVVEGANGGYVDASQVTYNVYLNGALQNQIPISETTYALILADDEVIKNTAEVEAIYEDKVSKRGVSNSLISGAYTLPLDLQMTHDLMDFVEIRDGNSDGCTWSYNHEDGALEYTYSKVNKGNDWAIFPPVRLNDVEKVYEVEVDARTYSDTEYPESLEVALCKSNDVRDRFIVLPETSINSYNGVTIKAKFTIKEAGDYKIWLHAVSPADSFWLQVTAIRIIESSASTAVPAECTDITAEGATYGQLKATVKFTMPTMSMDGKDLNPDDEITVLAYSEAGYNSVVGKPGSMQELVVATKQGQNIITLKASNAAGDGKEATVSVFTGVDVPGMAKMVYSKVSEDNRSLTFSWETSTVGKDGGFVDPAFVTYQVVRYDVERDYWWAYSDPGITGTEYTFTIEDGKALTIERLAVVSTNAAGSTTASEVVAAALGTPNGLPMTENFAAGDLTYDCIIIEHSSDECSGTWVFENPRIYVNKAAHENSVSLVSFATESGNTYSALALPKFTTKNQTSLTASFEVYCYGGMAEGEMFIRDYTGTETSLGTVGFDGEEGWKKFDFAFPQSGLNKTWIEIVVKGKFTDEEQYLILGSYEIKPTSSLENIAETNGELFGNQGNITFKNLNDQFVRIFSTDGKILFSQNIDAAFVVLPMQPGIYVVCYGAETKKIVVK